MSIFILQAQAGGLRTEISLENLFSGWGLEEPQSQSVQSVVTDLPLRDCKLVFMQVTSAFSASHSSFWGSDEGVYYFLLLSYILVKCF